VKNRLFLYCRCTVLLAAFFSAHYLLGGVSAVRPQAGFNIPDVQPVTHRQVSRPAAMRPGYDSPDLIQRPISHQVGRGVGVSRASSMPDIRDVSDLPGLPRIKSSPLLGVKSSSLSEGAKVGSRGVVTRSKGVLVVRQRDGQPFYRTFDSSNLPVDVQGRDGKVRRILPKTQHDLRKFRAKQNLAESLEVVTGRKFTVDMPEDTRMRELIAADIRPGTVPEENRAWTAGKWHAFSDQFIKRVESEFGVRLTPQQAVDLHKHAERFPILYLEDWDVKGPGVMRPGPDVSAQPESPRVAFASGAFAQQGAAVGASLRAEPTFRTEAVLAQSAPAVGASLQSTPAKRIRPVQKRPVETVAEETTVSPARIAPDYELRVKLETPEMIAQKKIEGGLQRPGAEMGQAFLAEPRVEKMGEETLLVTEGGLQRPGAEMGPAFLAEPRVEKMGGEILLVTEGGLQRPGAEMGPAFLAEPRVEKMGGEALLVAEGGLQRPGAETGPAFLAEPRVEKTGEEMLLVTEGGLVQPGAEVAAPIRVSPGKPRFGKGGKAGLLAVGAGAGLAGLGIAALVDDEGDDVTVEVSQEVKAAATAALAAGGIVGWLLNHCLQFEYAGAWWEIRPNESGSIAIISPDLPNEPISTDDFERVSGVPIQLTEDGRVFIGLHGGVYVVLQDGLVSITDSAGNLISPPWIRVLDGAEDSAAEAT